MLHALRQVLCQLASAAILCAILAQVNHLAASCAITFALPGLLVAYAGLRLPLGAGLASAFVTGLWLDAATPLPFGRQGFLLALLFCLVYRLRDRLPRQETLVAVVVALFANLALFVALAFFSLGSLPDPAAGGLRLLADLLVSQLLTALLGPWFLSLQHAVLRLAGAAPSQTVNRFA
jgi:cell shape-determining protein MreD